MDAVAITVGASWTLGGLLCLALAVPLMRGRVGRNPIYGVRFAESFRSDEAWYAINRFGGKRLAGWSVALIIVGVVALFLPLGANPGLALAVGLGPMVFVLVPVIETWRFARRYGVGKDGGRDQSRESMTEVL